MKKIRSYLAAIALLATLALSGLSLQGMGSASIANAASSWHASASGWEVGKFPSSQPLQAALPRWWVERLLAQNDEL